MNVPTINAARRALEFSSLDRVMPDVDHLLAGHTVVGNWSLGQICNHLTSSLTCSVEGFPAMAPWVVRTTIGAVLLRRTLVTGRVPGFVKLPPRFAPKPGVDDRAEAESLRAALWLFASHSSELKAHPMGGRLSRQDWERFHCIHCAHHLSFVLPTEARRSE
jgi:hypothetical protein